MTSHADRAAFRLSVLRRQAPRALIAAFVIVSAFSLVNWASGVSTPLDRLLNLPVAVLLLTSGWVASRPWLPDRLLPWLVATVSMVAVLVFEAQAAYAGTGSGTPTSWSPSPCTRHW